MPGLVISTALIISLSTLLGYHTYLILTHQSTIENSQLSGDNPFAHTKTVQKSNSERKQKKPLQIIFNKRQVVNPDNSPRAATLVKVVSDYKTNWKDVMGENIFEWFSPYRSNR